jgi:hypothetical protein
VTKVCCCCDLTLDDGGYSTERGPHLAKCRFCYFNCPADGPCIGTPALDEEFEKCRQDLEKLVAEQEKKNKKKGGKFDKTLTPAEREEIRKLLAPRQVIKTRFLRVTWNRSRMRGAHFNTSMWLPRPQRSRTFRLQVTVGALEVVWNRIPKADWHREEHWFYKPVVGEEDWLDRLLVRLRG